MIYIAERDPENLKDCPTYEQVRSDLFEHATDEDQDFFLEALAKYINGPQDKYADAELARVMRWRAESIIERSKE